ncbi:MAG: adenylate/guanylate cyclase domain-containing protein [Alphaproteobacteria bacterium]|nr:adenylate/guanylate cyclase domain-containing protein [Alphaproteobacteria bacterium]MBO6861407.1 adenylate/guanylate cyclase domain-containing protein [Alphaproteobacteria bacterium]
MACLTAALCASLITAIPGFDRFHPIDEDILLLVRQIVAPRDTVPDASPVAVVAITPETFTAPGLSGIPRILWTDQMAKVQSKVLEAGATVFAWDVILQNSAAKSMTGILGGRVDLDAGAERALRRLDRDLLIGMKTYGRDEGRVVLGYADLAQGPVLPHQGLRQMIGRGSALHSVNAYVDPDGIVRGVPLVAPTADGTEHVFFALEVARRHSGLDHAWSPPDRFEFGGRRVPVLAEAGSGTNMLVNFDPSPGAVPSFTFHDILACDDAEYLRWAFEGRAVLFGFVTDLEDRKLMSNRFVRHADFDGAPVACDGSPAPVAAIARNTESGVYLHAQAVRNLLDGDAVARPGTGVRLTAAFALALAAAGVAAFRRPPVALAATVGLIALYGVIAGIVFADGTVLPLTDPGAAALLALGGMIGFRFVTADQERRQVRNTFSQYLDRKVIEAMIDAGDVPELGGESRELSCFFSDIEAFSSISEKMGPPELVAFLNEYFKVIGRAIESHGGIIERFLGDAVCSVFGAPVRDENHAANAVRCALAIDRGLAAAQDRFDVPEGRVVRTRIGINTGFMTAGNVGAERRKTYTVMGDSVNLAARLESVNKQYGTLLMAGEDTVTATGGLFEWRMIDRVRVVGRDTPVGLYEPLGEAGTVAADILALRDAYEAALRQFQAGDFAAARAAFQTLADRGDMASRKAVARCDARLADPPPPGWDGITDLSKK